MKFSWSVHNPTKSYIYTTVPEIEITSPATYWVPPPLGAEKYPWDPDKEEPAIGNTNV